MKIEANSHACLRMAKTYREFGERRRAQGDETASAAGLTAADALEDVAELRTALAAACDIAEMANGSANGYDDDRAQRIIELRKKLLIGAT